MLRHALDSIGGSAEKVAADWAEQHSRCFEYNSPFLCLLQLFVGGEVDAFRADSLYAILDHAMGDGPVASASLYSLPRSAVITGNTAARARFIFVVRCKIRRKVKKNALLVYRF